MIGKLLRSTFVALIVAPIILVIIHVIAFYYYLAQYGVHLTLYNGGSLTIYTIVNWLLLIPESSRSLHNTISVIVAWLVAWYVAADWVKDRRVDLTSPFLAFLTLILYLGAWRHSSILVYIPESLTILFTSWIMGAFLFVRDKYRKEKTFFDVLEEMGFKLTPEEKQGVELPSQCPHCGALIYSYPTYCWRCGKKI